MAKPARKAPKAKDSPNHAEKLAMAKPITIMAIKNNSWLLLTAILCNTYGMSQRANTKVTPNSPVVLTRSNNSSPPILVLAPERKGTKSIMGTMIKSWNINIPKLILPWCFSI